MRWTEMERPTQPLMPQTTGQQQFAASPVGANAMYAHSPATDQRTNGVEVAFAWIFTLLSLGYMLPWAVAATRGKSNSVAVGILNLFLGWTVIGWVIALVMACTAHQQRVSMVQMVNAPHYYPPTSR
jgi:ABC-type transport system involved in cytochrome c biogenesis permease component